MKLKVKMFLASFAVFFILVIASYYLFNAYWMNDFKALEREIAVKELERGINLLKAEANRVGQVLHDYAAWAQSCDFVVTGRQKYRDENLQRDVLESLDIDFICFLKPNGDWYTGIYRYSEGKDITKFPVALKNFIMSNKSFWKSIKPKENTRDGYVEVDKCILEISAAPITHLHNNQEACGYMLMGFNLDPGRMRAYSRRLRQVLYLQSLDQKCECTKQGVCYEEINSKLLMVSMPFYDLFRKPVKLLEAVNHREITRNGQKAVNSFILWFIVAAGFIFVVIAVFIQLFMVRPLKNATERLNEFLKERNPEHKDILPKGKTIEPFPDFISLVSETAGLLEQAIVANTQLIMEIPLPLVMVDKHGKIVNINRLGTVLTGYYLEDVAGKPVSSVFYGEREQEELQDIDRNTCVETVIKTSEGTLIPVVRNISQITLNNEPYFIESFFDLSVNKKAGDQVKDYQLRVDKMVKDINALSQNLEIETEMHRKTRESLDKANAQMQTIDKLKSAIISNMSHEIRTPLNALVGFAELMLDENLSRDERKKNYEIIAGSATELLNILNEIIDLSKLESKDTEMRRESLKINALLHDIHDIWQGKYHNKQNFNLELPPDSNEEIIVADSEWFRIIFDKLLDNAFKFCPGNDITMGYMIEDERYVFYVKDNGPGMSPDTFDLIFKAFTQIEDSLTRHHGGLGVGLTIVRKAVEMMEGEVKVESTPEKGSCFTFIIPKFRQLDE